MVAQRVQNLTSIQEGLGLIFGLQHWLSIWHCRALPCRSQMQLGSGVAVAVA